MQFNKKKKIQIKCVTVHGMITCKGSVRSGGVTKSKPTKNNKYLLNDAV